MGFIIPFQAAFAKPKTKQEMVNSPSFPRRRESWLILCNELFLRNFLNIKQDSSLRGNDGISCVSGCCWGFVKVSGCLNAGANNRQPENAAPHLYGLLASRALAFILLLGVFRLPHPVNKIL